MPIPVHIVFSESGTDIGRASYFNVIEKLTLLPMPQGKTIVQVAPMRVTATWMANKEDLNVHFDFRMVVELPPNKQEIVIGVGEFLFSLPFHRVFTMLPLLTYPGAGVMWIKNQIKRKGFTEWLTQQCPVIIEDARTPASIAAEKIMLMNQQKNN